MNKFTRSTLSTAKITAAGPGPGPVLEDRYRRPEEGRGRLGREPRGDSLGRPCTDYGLSLLHKQNVSRDLSAVVAVAGAQEDGS